MQWWLWMIAGLALLALEAVTPGPFVIFFFGVAALVVGGLAAAGIATTGSLQGLLFCVIAVVLLLVFRRHLVAWLKHSGASKAHVDDLSGEIAVPLADIAPGGIGRAELRGTAWTAENAGAAAVRQGQRCIVQRADGLKIWIRPE